MRTLGAHINHLFFETLKKLSKNLLSIFIFLLKFSYHHIPLVRWLLHKYKCLWGVGGKRWGSSLQEGASHTYTLRLG